MLNIIQGRVVFFHFVSMISGFMSVFRKLKQLIGGKFSFRGRLFSFLKKYIYFTRKVK